VGDAVACLLLDLRPVAQELAEREHEYPADEQTAEQEGHGLGYVDGRRYYRVSAQVAQAQARVDPRNAFICVLL